MRKIKRLYAVVAMVLISSITCGLLFHANAAADVEEQDSLLQCSWIDKFDSSGHWQECQNHHDTGSYNGIWHYEGRKTKTKLAHTMATRKQATCLQAGEQYCTMCGYAVGVSTLPHTFTGDYLQEVWAYECDRKLCSICNLHQATGDCLFTVVPDNTGKTYGTIKSVRSGYTWYTLNAKSACSKGGTHTVDDTSFQHRDYRPHFYDAGSGDGLKCTKCGQIVLVKAHSQVENYCKSCNKILAPQAEWKIAAHSGCAVKWELSIPKAQAQKITPQSATLYIANQSALKCDQIDASGIKDVSTATQWKYQFTLTRKAVSVNGSIVWNWSRDTITYFGYDYVNSVGDSGYASIHHLQEYDLDAPVMKPEGVQNAGIFGLGACYYPATSVTPSGTDDTWGNFGQFIVPYATDTGSGQIQYSLWYGDTCLVPWKAAEYGDTSKKDNPGKTDTFAGNYPDWTTLTFKTRDMIGNVSTYDFQVRHIENEPPVITWEFSTTEQTTKPVTITLHGTDAHSGFNRIRLPDGSFTANPNITFDATTNGEYYVRAEDNLGNARTVKITVSNIVDVVGIQITTTPFTINPNNPPGSNTATGGSITLSNPNSYPVTVTIDKITAQMGSIPVVMPNAVPSWGKLGIQDSGSHIAVGIRDGGVTTFPIRSAYRTTLAANSSKTVELVTYNGLSFPTRRNLKYDLHVVVKMS